MHFPTGLSFLSSRHRIVVVPQDGDCALHVIVRARQEGTPLQCRQVISSRITPGNFQMYKRQYTMTSAPHIRKRVMACETATALRAIIDHASYYMTNDDLVDLGFFYGFYPIVINQKYHDKSALGVLKETLVLCDPYNVVEAQLRTSFLGGDIPAILFYNRSDISHYESIECKKENGWTALINVSDLDPTLRLFMDTHCGIVSTEPLRYRMDENKQYIEDIDELVEALGTVNRVEDEFGETLQVRDNVYISVSSHYPRDRPTIVRDGNPVDISSFWTSRTTLLEIVQPIQQLEVRYQRYLNDKSILRPMLLRACRMYQIRHTGMAKMRRFMLCLYVADFETNQRLPPFTGDDDEDAIVKAMMGVSL